MFFVSSGVVYDLSALTRSPSALARIPLFLLATLSVIRAGHIDPAAPHATPPIRGGCGAPHASDDQPVQKEG